MAEEKKKSAAQQVKSAQNAPKSAKNKKKTPLWLKIARFLYAFFAAIWEWIKEKAKALWAFLKDFFTGLPDGLRYLHKKNKKKREQRRKRKAIEKAKKEKAAKTAPTKEQLAAEKKAKKQAEKRKEDERKKEAKKREQTAGAKQTPQTEVGKRLGKSGLRFLPYAALGVLIFYLSSIILAFGVLYIKDSIELPKGEVQMVTTVEGKEYKSSISAANAYPDGGRVLYYSMNVLAERFDMSTICDGETAIFKLKDGEVATMRQNSRTVELNGSSVNLSAPVHIKENKVYVPLELLIRYASGLNISVGSGRITLLQETDEELSRPKAPVYKDLRFTVSGLLPAELPEFDR